MQGPAKRLGDLLIDSSQSAEQAATFSSRLQSVRLLCSFFFGPVRELCAYV